MDARALCENFKHRGIAITAKRAKLIVRPANRLTDNDRCAIRENKAHLLRLLHEREVRVANEAYAGLLETLGRVEELSIRTSIPVRHRIAEILSEFGPKIESLFEQRDFQSIRYALVDFERNVADAVGRRGYDN